MPSFFRPGYKTPELYQFKVNLSGKEVVCYKDSIRFRVTNQDRPDSVLWSLQDQNNLTIWQGKGENITLKPLSPGKYQLTATVYLRCLWSQKSISFEVEAEPLAQINGKDTNTLFICDGAPLELHANSGKYHYQWSNGNNTNRTTVNKHGQYSLKATNSCGTAEASTKVAGDTWEIPNIITPNEDGINDFWKPKNLSGSLPSVQILNRWGSEVFKTEYYKNDWNASNVPDGLYFYNLGVEGGCGQKGWVQVLR